MCFILFQFGSLLPDLSSSSHTGTQLQAARLGELSKVAVLREAFRNAEWCKTPDEAFGNPAYLQHP